MSDLATPVVHLNGTSKQELLDQLCEAIEAIHDAGRKLAHSCPNGRDYYLLPGDALNVALQQHDARMAKLREVTVELEQIAYAVQDQ